MHRLPNLPMDHPTMEKHRDDYQAIAQARCVAALEKIGSWEYTDDLRESINEVVFEERKNCLVSESMLREYLEDRFKSREQKIEDATADLVDLFLDGNQDFEFLPSGDQADIQSEICEQVPKLILDSVIGGVKESEDTIAFYGGPVGTDLSHLSSSEDLASE